LNTIENTLFIGKVFLHFPRLDSTNQFATDYISKNNPSEGTVISTYCQDKGRGQIGSKWESTPDKNISLSVILYPTFVEIQQQFLLSQTISLGIFDFISKHLDRNIKVKWPNDIYVKDKKIAGTLIQNTLTANKFQSSVVGIGININQLAFLSDAPNPTSFKIETGKTYDLDEMVKDLCWSIEKRYLQLRSHQNQIIQQDYLNNLYRFMEDGLFQRPEGTIFNGKIVGVTEQGKLRLVHNKGEENFEIKGVKFL